MRDQALEYKLAASSGDYASVAIEPDSARSGTITGLSAVPYVVRLKYELGRRGPAIYSPAQLVLPSDDFGAKFIAEITVGDNTTQRPGEIGYFVYPGAIMFDRPTTLVAIYTGRTQAQFASLNPIL